MTKRIIILLGVFFMACGNMSVALPPEGTSEMLIDQENHLTEEQLRNQLSYLQNLLQIEKKMLLEQLMNKRIEQLHQGKLERIKQLNQEKLGHLKRIEEENEEEEQQQEAKSVIKKELERNKLDGHRFQEKLEKLEKKINLSDQRNQELAKLKL